MQEIRSGSWSTVLMRRLTTMYFEYKIWDFGGESQKSFMGDATIISVLKMRFAYRRQSVVDGILRPGECRTQGIGRPKIPIWQTM